MFRISSKRLCQYAKKVITNYFSNKITEPTDYIKKQFSSKNGASITLYSFGELRGKNTVRTGMFPAWKAVAEATINAAFSDPSNPPLTQEELDELEIEVALFNKPIPVKDINCIDIKKHGIIIKKGYNESFVTPQETKELYLDKKEAIQLACRRAGLKSNAWQEDDTEILKFEVKCKKA